MFRVYDNGKPASYKFHKVDPSWAEYEYETFEQAEAYCLSWLGIYAPPIGVLQPNKPYNYSGMNDYIEIREVTKV